MMTLHQALANLVSKGIIDHEIGLEKASNVEEFTRLLEPSEAKARVAGT